VRQIETMPMAALPEYLWSTDEFGETNRDNSIWFKFRERMASREFASIFVLPLSLIFNQWRVSSIFEEERGRKNRSWVKEGAMLTCSLGVVFWKALTIVFVLMSDLTFFVQSQHNLMMGDHFKRSPKERFKR
jgi:hypothetical protein